MMAKYLDDVNLLGSFKKVAFSGITANDLDAIVTNHISDKKWKKNY